MSPQKLHIMHGRDHCPDGADPIPCLPPASPGSQPYADTVVGIGSLVGYWRMGAASGVQPDTSGYPLGAPDPKDLIRSSGSTSGTYNVTGADPLVASGDDDGAFRFNYNGSGGSGSGDYFSVSDPATTPRWGFAGLLPFSCTLFVRPKSGWTISPSSEAVALVGTQFSGGSPNLQGWGLALYPPGSAWAGSGQVVTAVRGNVLSGADQLVVGVPDIPSDEWTHVAFTYDGTTMRLYYDGEIVASMASSLSLTAQALITVGWGNFWNATNRFFYGDIDEIAVYSKALTAEEVASLSPSADATTPGSTVLISDGSGGATWGKVTSDAIEDATIVDADVATGADLAVSKLAAGTEGYTLKVVGGVPVWAASAAPDPADDPTVWLPLSTVVGGTPELVWDADDSLIPTLTTI